MRRPSSAKNGRINKKRTAVLSAFFCTFLPMPNMLVIQTQQARGRNDEKEKRIVLGWILCGVWCRIAGGAVVSHPIYSHSGSGCVGADRHFAVAMLKTDIGGAWHADRCGKKPEIRGRYPTAIVPNSKGKHMKSSTATPCSRGAAFLEYSRDTPHISSIEKAVKRREKHGIKGGQRAYWDDRNRV